MGLLRGNGISTSSGNPNSFIKTNGSSDDKPYVEGGPLNVSTVPYFTSANKLSGAVRNLYVLAGGDLQYRVL